MAVDELSTSYHPAPAYFALCDTLVLGCHRVLKKRKSGSACSNRMLDFMLGCQ
jgi:hypothetical protein